MCAAHRSFILQNPPTHASKRGACDFCRRYRRSRSMTFGRRVSFWSPERLTRLEPVAAPVVQRDDEDGQ